MILHIISKSPHQHSAFNDAMPFIADNDIVVFIDDGVYATNGNSSAYKSIKDIKAKCFALFEDVETRGITTADKVESITMADFVELVFKADKNISWY